MYNQVIIAYKAPKKNYHPYPKIQKPRLHPQLKKYLDQALLMIISTIVKKFESVILPITEKYSNLQFTTQLCQIKK